MAKSDKKPASVSDSSVFDSLFGDIPAEIAEASIFSENNPFRRKPGGYTQPPPEDSSAEPKKRKKDISNDEEKEPKKERGNDEWKEPQGVQSGAVDRKKKRKRDEVEAEYEVVVFVFVKYPLQDNTISLWAVPIIAVIWPIIVIVIFYIF